MYKPKISDSIIGLMIENSLNKISYSELYKKLCDRLNCQISHRDYSSNLKYMLDLKILDKEDAGARGSTVYYYLSGMGAKEYELKLLGTGDEYDRILSLYQLLISFEEFKRGDLLNDKQLDRFLAKIGSSRESLTEIDTPFKDHPILHVAAAFIDPIREVQITQYDQKRFGKTMYYVVKLGFSPNEFISYIKKVKNHTEPRPFSQNPSLIPFARFLKYSKEEVEGSVDRLLRAGLIEPITFTEHKDERRFRVRDKSLVKVLRELRMVEIVYFHRIVAKMGLFEKPDKDDRDFLIRYMGERTADTLIARYSDYRRNFLKNCTREQKKEAENMMNHLNWLFQNMISIFKENEEFLRDYFLREFVLPFPVYGKH